MPKPIRYAIWAIVAHTVASVLHGLAHLQLGIALSLLQIIFIALVIALAPFLALALLLQRRYVSGSFVLLFAMLGSFIFGIYNHYAVISPDHVSQTPANAWDTLFQLTAFLLALTEFAGAILGFWILLLHMRLHPVADDQ